uniref:F-box and leucine rich repeat protein n=1 Tax=Tetraodon nigroviridis TaxID=99883 RepID=H3CTT2_TETNG
IRALGRRSVCRLSIRQLDGFGVSRLLLQEVGVCLGPRLESLALPGSSLTEASLLGLLPRLTSLRRLDLRGLDSLFMSGAFLSWEEHRQQVRAALCGLEELDLSDLRYLSDLTFNRLTSCTPRLRRLALAGCHITFEFDPYRDSSALLSLRNLRRLLAEQKASLVALDLSRTSISPQSLCSIAQVQGLVLEELLLQGCKELTDYAVEALVEHQPRLRCLDLSGCPELRSRSAEALSLSGDWRITEKGLADLLAVRTLRSLDLSGCPRVSGAEMAKGLKGASQRQKPTAGTLSHRALLQVVWHPELQRLSLSALSDITDASLAAVARRCPSLSSLALRRCPGISDRGVAQAAPHLPRLQHLYLSGCHNVTDRSLFTLLQHCGRLRTLDISGCPNVAATTADFLQSQLP